MSDRRLNQVLNGLNQNRSLRQAFHPVEMNRDFSPVIRAPDAGFKANLNLLVKRFPPLTRGNSFAAPAAINMTCRI